MTQSTVHFETLGCKLNQIESEAAARAFSDVGFNIDMTNCTAALNVCNDVTLCVMNTCTVTSKAEQKARRIIRLMLEKYPRSAILVTGCYAEVEPEQILSINKRIAVLKGTEKEYLSRIPDAIQKYYIEKQQVHGDASGENSEGVLLAEFLRNHIQSQTPETLRKSTFTLATDTFLSHSRASIKIQDGCSNNCAYCRIHIARGKPVSLEAGEALDRIRKLEAAGQREVVLTGVNLSQYYSEDCYGTMRFPDLLKFLLAETHEISFRISSLYPDIVTDEFCSILKHPRVRPHFHLSVQSGSDRILKLMHRPYGADDVIAAAERLRAAKPDCFLAADIITGFPGETEEDFKLSEELCRKCGLSWIHVFPFSSRPGTEAARMKPQIPQYISRDRAEKLAKQAICQKEKFLDAMIGKKLSAIVEKRRIGEVRGVTENFIHVRINGLNKADAISLGGSEVAVVLTGKLPVGSQTESVEAEAVLISE